MDQSRAAALRDAKNVRRCVWPGCGTRHMMVRVGPLCWEHAQLVADAVNESTHRVISNAQADAATRRQREAEQRAKVAASRGQHPGWIYYVRVGDRIKIGYSVDVKRRMRAYPPDSRLLAVHPGTPQLETEMHQRFAGSLAAGREWFRESTDLAEHIAQVVTQFGEPTQHRHHFRTDAPALRGVRLARPA